MVTDRLVALVAEHEVCVLFSVAASLKVGDEWRRPATSNLETPMTDQLTSAACCAPSGTGTGPEETGSCCGGTCDTGCC